MNNLTTRVKVHSMTLLSTILFCLLLTQVNAYTENEESIFSNSEKGENSVTSASIAQKYDFNANNLVFILYSISISIASTECLMDNQYNVTFIIPNDSFNYDIYINDQLDGNYAVENMSITLDSNSGSGNSKDVFKFCQNGSDSCCVELIVYNPCICGFADITSEITECNESDSTYFTH